MRSRGKHFWPIATILLILAMTAVSLGEKVQAAQLADTETFTPTSTETLTPTFSPTSTSTSTLPSTSTQFTTTPFAPTHIVISEFRTRGPNGDKDEFVELFNPSGAAVNISGWTIRRSSDCGTSVFLVATIANNITLNAGQHYLLISSSSSSVGGGDQSFSPSLTDNGGLALVDPTGAVIDAAGMCNTTFYREGANLSPLSGNANQSYERKPGGPTACYDIGSNAADFSLISPPNPQNRNTPIALCTGVSTYTPTRTPTLTPTRTRTRTATTIPGFVIINEFLPHPSSDWNEDGEVNVNDEYIELINLSVSPVSIKNWKLDNGANTTSYALPDIKMLPRQILVFFRFETNIPLSDGGGTVRLVKSDGRTADIFTYPPVEAMDETWCRLYSGTGFLTFACVPTPGRPNLVANPTPAVTPTPAGIIENRECNLADTVPLPVTSAECNNAGGGIWQAPPINSFLLPRQGKWLAFIE